MSNTLSSGFRPQGGDLRVFPRMYLDPEDFEIRRISREIQTLGFACEQAIRPFVVGRKAWLFSGSPVGATASAGWYSLIESAKINAVEPYLYLRSVLSRLPESEDPKDYRMFLPWNIDKALLLDFDSGHLS